jgi:hypothetical protein
MLLNKSSITPMNLQLFASGMEDEEFQNRLMQMFDGAEQQQTEEPTPVETPEGATMPAEQPPAQDPVQGTDPTQELQPSGEPGTPGPQQELIGGKFKSVDDLLNAYTNIESFATRKAQEAAQYKAMAEQIQNQQSQFQDPAPEQTSPEEVDPLEDEEALSELLYSDPVRVIKMIKESAIREAQSTVQPLLERDAQAQKQAEWQERVDGFAAEHPDLDRWSESMARIIMENPELRDHPKGLELAYHAAKGQHYAEPPDPTIYLQDQDFVKNNIIGNEEIKNQIIQQYLTELQNGGQPLSIGQSQAGGSTPMTPPKRPASIEEAGEMALSWMNKQK